MTGYYQPPPEQAPYYARPLKRRTSTPIVGGIFLVIAGIQGVLIGLLFLFSGSIASVLSDYYNYGDLDVSFILNLCGVMFLIFGFLALLGAVMAFQRKRWGLALIGAIFGLFTIGVLFTASLSALVALILIAVSRDEFD